MRLKADSEYGALQALRESRSAEATCECPQEFEVLRGPRGSFSSRSRHGNSVVGSALDYIPSRQESGLIPLLSLCKSPALERQPRDGSSLLTACTALRRWSEDSALRL